MAVDYSRIRNLGLDLVRSDALAISRPLARDRWLGLFAQPSVVLDEGSSKSLMMSHDSGTKKAGVLSSTS